jgi:hypothetical protein
MVRLATCALIALCSAGCGSKGAVSLVAIAERPSLTVDQVALGTTLAGGFDLVLELGEYAEESVSVSPAGFGLHRDGETLVERLTLASAAQFPVTIAPGKSQRIALSIATDDTQSSAVGDALCAGSLVYQGGVIDEGGELTPTSSAAFSPSCP